MSEEPQQPYEVSPDARRRANLTGLVIMGLIVLAIVIKFTTTSLGW